MEHLLWVEKYRPKTIQDCILPDAIKSTFQEYVNRKEIPNLLLSGTAGVGKMAGSPEEDETAANNILSLVGKGHFFSQSWGKIPENDKEFVKLVHRDQMHHVTLEDESWRAMKKCCPIISGGLNPTLLKPFIDIMGNVDFITTMGAGCHAHPRGTEAGAKALVQACEAYIKKIPIEKYAKTHPELKEAIEFFSKNKSKEIKQAESSEKN